MLYDVIHELTISGRGVALYWEEKLLGIECSSRGCYQSWSCGGSLLAVSVWVVGVPCLVPLADHCVGERALERGKLWVCGGTEVVGMIGLAFLRVQM